MFLGYHSICFSNGGRLSGFKVILVMKVFDVSEERTYTIFRATEMFQVDIEVTRNSKMYRLFMAYFLPPHHLSNHSEDGGSRCP